MKKYQLGFNIIIATVLSTLQYYCFGIPREIWKFDNFKFQKKIWVLFSIIALEYPEGPRKNREIRNVVLNLAAILKLRTKMHFLAAILKLPRTKMLPFFETSNQMQSI